MIYGYLRGSTGAIDKNNQRNAIDKIATARGIKIEYVEDTVSSGKPYAKRKISNLVKQCKRGDKIIVAELTRFARNVEEMLMIARLCLEKGIELEILNPAMLIDESISSKAMLTIMGLAGEMERHFIKMRTRQSLQVRKEAIEKNGFFINKVGEKVFSLGAKKGRYQQLKLEPQADLVLKYRNKKLNNTAVSKLLDCNRLTVERFLKRFPIKHGKYVNPPLSLKQK